MFLFITLIVLSVYYNNGWTTIGPGLTFCLVAMLCDSVCYTGNKIVTAIKSKG